MISRRGDRQNPADRLDPVGLMMIVDERDHGWNRRELDDCELRLGKISRRLAQDVIRLPEFPVLPLQRLQPFSNFNWDAAPHAVVDLSLLDPLIERLSPCSRSSRQSKSPAPIARDDPSRPRKPAEPRVCAPRMKTGSSSCLPSLHLLKVRSLRQTRGRSEFDSHPFGNPPIQSIQIAL